MSPRIRRLLEERRLVRTRISRNRVIKEMDGARYDLERAQKSLSDGDFKWATVQAYYAMFHAARALVYSQGYREKSHYCLAVALGALFVDDGAMEAQSVRDFLNAMNLREAADYEAEFSQSGAKAVIASAEKFIEKATAILGISG